MEVKKLKAENAAIKSIMTSQILACLCLYKDALAFNFF